jgi:ankyrin repeat protein
MEPARRGHHHEIPIEIVGEREDLTAWERVVTGEVTTCLTCGEPLFQAVPHETTSDEITAFAQRATFASAERIAADGWIHPGIYCPNGCTVVLIDYGYGPKRDAPPPLVYAAQNGNVAQVVRLLEEGVDINAVDRWGKTAFGAACLRGHRDVMRVLIERGGINIHKAEEADDGTTGRYTPVFRAAEAGYADIVDLLLDHGADSNVALWAAAGRGHKEVMQRVLFRGADPSTVLWDYTVLMKAVAHKQTEAVRLLLDVGADLNAQVPTTGRTALMRAAEQNFSPVMALLLGRGADTSLRDSKGETALDIARRLNKAAMVEMLLVAGTAR